MNERIERLTELTLSGKMYVSPVKTKFEEADMLLPKQQMESKHLCEYILNQEPKITEYSCMTGFFNMDSSVVGDAFRRGGHTATRTAMKLFYLKPVDNLSTMEWQHATADFSKILDKGLSGIISDIDKSLAVHTSPKHTDFLYALKNVANALISWAYKCSKRVLDFSVNVKNEQYRKNLRKLAQTLLNVPRNAPNTFYEAVLCIYICFSADPDSIGTLDRYLRPFYEKDIQSGALTKVQAAEYLQELFLMLQAATPISSANFTRGGESHFCIGGYLPDGEDGFCDLSRLIVESMIELPTYIPQLTLRWTKKTPREAFRFMLDCERHDPNKRIAFQNDEKRIKCYTEICHIPFEKAVSYTTAGCNEPVFLGAIAGSNSKINFAHSMETIFHKKSNAVANAKSFDEFFGIFRQELFNDLRRAYEYDNFYNSQRAQDINYISSLVFDGCIENARSLTQGGCNTAVASPMCIGITNVIDSLCVVKQFVFDERMFTMQELITALIANWQGYDDMRTLIVKKGKFFGNDDDNSNYVAQRLYRELYEFLKDQTNLYGYHWLIGDLMGYNIHHKWFGEHTKATPDGRYAGENLKFGLGQSGGYDRSGLTAFLNSVAKLDPNGIGCGSTVTNLMLDEKLVKDDDNFEKTVDMLETYFKKGGVHFQLTYVSKEDLISAKRSPDDYANLRVRVTGFSDYFVKLNEAIQDDIIARTTHK